MTAQPYRTTPVFDERSLPLGLRRDHSTKAGVWGVIRVLDGRLRLFRSEGARDLAPGRPGLVAPEQVHRVEPVGRVRMQVEFYAGEPLLMEAQPIG
jgi:tellurite resistance-related uncharacterized protein